MTELHPDEKILRGQWIFENNHYVADEVSTRITTLTASFLERLGSDTSGWDILYRDPNDGRFWELIYPESQLQGGGPPMLRYLTRDEARDKYNGIVDA